MSYARTYRHSVYTSSSVAYVHQTPQMVMKKKEEKRHNFFTKFNTTRDDHLNCHNLLNSIEQIDVYYRMFSSIHDLQMEY